MGGKVYAAPLAGLLPSSRAAPMTIAGHFRTVLPRLGDALRAPRTPEAESLTEPHDPRLRAVAAICTPLDLDATSAAFERPQSSLYRYYILRRLREIYREVAARHPVPTPVEALREVWQLRDFDRLTVAPRFGFASAEDYYAKASVGPLLPRIAKPALLLEAEDDPMVPRSTVMPALALAPPALDVRWVKRGGHVSLPSDLDLGMAAPRGMTGQALGWLLGR